MNDVLDDQLRYYRARAAIYDQTYERTGPYDRGHEANLSWKAEIDLVGDHLNTWPGDGHILELGCGTGHWTARLARTAGTVTALDGAPEMIDIAARKLTRYSNVETRCVEIIDTWSPSEETYDAFVAFFFIEHVPDNKLDHLLRRIAKTLRPGADIFIAEGAPRRTDAPEVETRLLDGLSYRVVERRRTPDELSTLFHHSGMEINFTTTGRFHIGTGRYTSLADPT